MKKNFILVLAIFMIIIGICFCYFAKWELADIEGFALTMFGSGLAASAMWNKRDPNKKIYISIVGIVLIGAGGFILGFGGFDKGTLSVIISSVFGLVAIIAGLIITAMQAKNQKAVE